MEITHRNRLLTALVVGIVLLCGWFAYQPALSGAFLLDDNANLGGLKHIDDSGSALHFVLSGSAGPVGRPLALASFLPQANSWETGAAPFLTVNILIHLFNASLLGTFLYFLTSGRGSSRSEARSVALAAMALWLFMPLLATSTLMIVQRMTTLSATFVLLGLNAYVLARRSCERNANAGLVGMSVALVMATLLAVLTKESGALLPVLILVIEVTLLKPPAGLTPARWRAWMTVFLVLPTALIVGYVATRVPYSEALVLKRGFSGWERLLTESRILWEYLLNAFIPRPGRYTPFHDAYPVARSLFDPLTFLAFAGWVVMTIIALAWRKKYPLLAFAVFWFLAGHLLESTTIALEPYFEHRNYIPVVGPVYAFCHSVLRVPQRYQRIVRVGMPLYVLVNTFFLFSLTTLWGNPAMAMRYWYELHPESSRAVTAMATWQLETGGPGATLHTLRDFVARNPDHAYIAIPALNLSCIIAPGQDYRDDVESLNRLLPGVKFSYTAGTMLSQLLTTASRHECQGLDSEAVGNMAQRLADNTRYASDNGYQQLHHQLMARIARDSGNIESALEHLQMAMDYQPGSRLNMMVVTTLVSADRFDDARAFIQEAGDELPFHPLRRWLWQLELAELMTYVDRSEGLPAPGDGKANGSGASGNG